MALLGKAPIMSKFRATLAELKKSRAISPLAGGLQKLPTYNLKIFGTCLTNQTMSGKKTLFESRFENAENFGK